MNKANLIETLAVKTNFPKKDVETVLNAFEQIIIDTLKAGDEVTLTGFGTFIAKKRSARLGVNPRKPAEKIQIPEVMVPKFKAGQNLKNALKTAHS